jgi:hypothetical protein
MQGGNGVGVGSQLLSPKAKINNNIMASSSFLDMLSSYSGKSIQFNNQKQEIYK